MNVFSTALLNTLMGMGTVFVVLICISLIISLFVYVPGLETKWKRMFSHRKKKQNTEERPAPKRPVLEEETEEISPEDDSELVAVITAAIIASMGGTVSKDQLVVRSIRRVKRR